MDEIKLNSILTIDPSEYRDWTLCLNNANAQGVYSFEQDKARLMEHISWHKTAGKKTAFRNIYTKYCLEFIRLDKDSKYDQWLFLGAYETHGIKTDQWGNETYDLQPIERFIQFRDKLIVRYKKHQGDKQAKIRMENIESMEVVKILEKPYIKTFKEFEGYDHVSMPFKELELLIKSNVDNWRELLSNVNGVYVITDMSNGKLYVGSTYGHEGVWQRWSAYVYSDGTGGNKELKALNNADANYARNNFKFTILEVFLNQDSNNKNILNRENYWKEVLCTRQFGYNDN